MPRPFSFGPSARLGSRKDFERVFARGRRAALGPLALWHLPRPEPGGARLGLVVGSKLGPAVRRNRLKRLAREAFRLSQPGRTPSADMVLALRPGCRWPGLAQAQAQLTQLWRREGLT